MDKSLENAEFGQAIAIVRHFVQKAHPEPPRHVQWALDVLKFHEEQLRYYKDGHT